MKDSLDKIISDAQQASTWLAYRKAVRQINELSASDKTTLKSGMKVAFVSSFTIDPLVDFTTVEAAASSIGLGTYIAPFGQVSQETLNPQSGLYVFIPDVTVLIAEADKLAEKAIDAADEIIALAQSFRQNTSGLLVVTTFMAPPDWPLHLLPSERQLELDKANQRLRETFKDDPRVQICDLAMLASYYGYTHALSPEMMAMARMPFAESFLVLLAKKLVSHFKVHAGLIRKCIVLDCDNTLWGGIIGEDGMDGIALGPDCPGREFVDFQKAILELYEQGVILAINSKNNEADILQVLREHPHMVLKEEHFAAICVNWNPKPDNMKTIAGQVNIGLDTLVFVDDNPAERQIMNQMLPEIDVLELPANPALYAKTLRETNFFAKASLTEEDKGRGQMYAAQRQRSRLQQSTATLEDYLKSLEMTCSIRPAEEKDIKRAAQLTQRTNQFNLTTRRYTEPDIRHMVESPDWEVYVLGLKDKFGDNGTVGLAMVEKQKDVWQIDTFLMSCRVIGRQAEDAFVDRICRDAVTAGATGLKAEYTKTQKNALAADFWDKMNFKKQASDEKRTDYKFSLIDYGPKKFEYLNIES
ncbi:MAG: HAD family hydrolase [Phycisphaerae bacterium]|nr:HAD family hydrolase [Phycisphaerae bacterium]